MRKRTLVIASLIFTICLITSQVTQPVLSQDESIKEAVKSSIDGGVEFLVRTQLPNGSWAYQGQSNPASDQVIGSSALCGLALMECGLPITDKHITKTTGFIRAAVSNQRFNYNYSVCLSLLFLDRLHRGSKLNHSDSGTIIRLAHLIVNGQCPDGGWTYNLPGGIVSDNSNTQFAVVALWVARKYKPDAAIDKALNRADKKFRNSERTDTGGWGYDIGQMSTAASGSMTCAGLLGIALNAGVRKQSEATFRSEGSAGSTGNVYQALQQDEQVAKARVFLQSAFTDYINNRSKHGHITYFFWSLERVATLYQWKKLDEAKTIDWYELGAKYLIRIQNKQRGDWSVDFQQIPAVETSFALLFLSKSNLLGPLQEATFTNPGDGSIAGTLESKPKEQKPVVPKNHQQYANELAAKLVKALANERESILIELRDAPLGKDGAYYTDALVDVIGKLTTNVAKEQAREALAGRLQRLTTKTLITYLNDDNRELRLAAASAARVKNDLEAASGLIPLLSDQDPVISNAALDALKEISKQNFGKSVSRWSRWLDAIKDKKP